jgi:2-iminobutanoate/2-iminopropanoate deaminase
MPRQRQLTINGRHNGYSPGLGVDVLAGEMVFVSGQIARTDDGEIIGGGDARAQVRACFDQIEALLVEAGGSLRDVTRLVYYFVDIDADLPLVREVRDSYDWEVAPASTAVQVSRLVDPELRVEIEATAIVSRKPSLPARRQHARALVGVL